ncbi:MAG: ATP-binding protein [Bacteroidota bacterium]
MKLIEFRRASTGKQIAISSTSILVVSAACFLVRDWLGDYHISAFILLLNVSILAVLLEIIPVLIAALLSALIWNFLFIPPLFTFHIDNAHDVLLFFMYFFVAFVSAVLTTKIRSTEKQLLEREREENSIQLYNTLFNSLSHELKTPISTIIGATDTLKEAGNKLSEENKEALIHEIEKAGTRLHQQLENLLNMSRVESGNLRPKMDWIDLPDLIHQIIRKMPVDYKQQIEIEVQKDLPIFKVDALFIEQIVANLISNAIHYTPDHSAIKLKINHQNEVLKMEIEDNGTGFSEETLPKVFDKFYRVPNSRTGGTGLGLSIVKGFTEALNGSVSLHNNSIGGATFVVEIPCESSYINNLKNE